MWIMYGKLVIIYIRFEDKYFWACLDFSAVILKPINKLSQKISCM
jgi:hypothetical protein